MDSKAMQCLGYQQLSVSSSALTLTVPTQATGALIRVETANVRVRMDGTAPTASVGMPLLSTDTIPFTFWGSGSLKNFQVIAQSGTATVNVMYFG